VVARRTPRTSWALLKSSRVGGQCPGTTFPRAPPPCLGPKTPHQPPRAISPCPSDTTAGLVSSSPQPCLAMGPAWSRPVPREVPDARGWGCPWLPCSLEGALLARPCLATPWLPLGPVAPQRGERPPSWLADRALPHCWHQRGGSHSPPAPCKGTEAGFPPQHWPSPAEAVASSSHQGKVEIYGGRAEGDSSRGCGTEAI